MFGATPINLTRRVNPGEFARWFRGPKLDAAGRERMLRFLAAFRLQDMALVPISPRECRVGLMGAPKMLLRMVRGGIRGAWWREQIAQLAGDRVPYGWRIYNDNGGPGVWKHIDDYGLVDWMEFDDFIPAALKDGFGPGWPDEVSLFTTVIPAPGQPARWWYSVRQDRWMPPGRKVAWNACTPLLADRARYGRAGDPIAISVGRGVPPFFAAHAVGVDHLHAVPQCGGLMWPSFALTWKMHAWSSSNAYFFMGVPGIMQSFGRGRARTMSLTNTDAWTATAKSLEAVAKEASEELQGEKEMRGNWLYVFGPNPDEGLKPDNLKALSSIPKIAARIKHLAKLHGSIPGQRIEPTGKMAEGDHYPYLELKVNDVWPVAACPLVLAVGATREEMQHAEWKLKQMLPGLGFRGLILSGHAGGVPAREEEQARARVADELLRRYLDQFPQATVAVERMR